MRYLRTFCAGVAVYCLTAVCAADEPGSAKGDAAGASAIGQVVGGVVAAADEQYGSRQGGEEFLPKSEGFSWRMMLVEQMPQYETFLVTFPSPFVSPYPENNTVHAEYYRPVGKKEIPGVVVLHILGGDFEISRILSRHLASQGIGALFVQMAYYGSRRPQGPKRIRLISEDVDQTLAGTRQTIMDVRRAALWLSLRPEVDAGKIGIAGTSLGAFIATLCAGMDTRFRRCVFVLGGGDIAKVLWEGEETVKQKRKLEGQGFTYESLSQKLRPVEPLSYAGAIDPRGVLMVNAKHDKVVPPWCTETLWEKLGRPKIYWYECDHYSMLAYIFDVLAKVGEHFETGRWDVNKEKTNG